MIFAVNDLAWILNKITSIQIHVKKERNKHGYIWICQKFSVSLHCNKNGGKFMEKNLKHRFQLVKLLKGLKGGTLVTLTTLTPVRIENCPIKGHILKWCKQTMQVGVSYENAINIRLSRLGFGQTFKSNPLPYGKWLIPNRVIDYNGRKYARFYPVRNANTKVCYFIDGRFATAKESEVISMYEQYNAMYSDKQKRHGLSENQVELRNYRFESILGLTAEGNSYKMEFSRISATRPR